MRPYYSYSVKDVLKRHFGESPIISMRMPHSDSHNDTDMTEEQRLAFLWQAADGWAMTYFLDNRFYIDTVLEEDHLVYLAMQRGGKVAYIILTKDGDTDLVCDISYTKEIAQKWQDRGYSVRVLVVNIRTDYYGKSHSFRFVSIGANILRSECVNGEEILVYDDHPCWSHFYNKLNSAVSSGDIKDYECVLDPNATVTQEIGEHRHSSIFDDEPKNVLAVGCENVKRFLEKHFPLRIRYEKDPKEIAHSRIMSAGGYDLTVYVNRRNLISKIRIEKTSDNARNDTIYVNALPRVSLAASVPTLRKALPLDPKEMHGLVIQLYYSDGAVKNYYLACFQEREIPSCVTVYEKSISLEAFRSLSVNSDGGISIGTDLEIPAHRLYYHSYRQEFGEVLNDTVYEDGMLRISGIRKTPLKEIRQYFGREDECFGPAEFLLDKDGKRFTNLSFYSTPYDKQDLKEPLIVSVEPSLKYGVLNSDGAWLVPPIYDAIDDFHRGYATAKRIIDGEEKSFLLDHDGNVVDENPSYDISRMCNDRCPFNELREPVKTEFYGYYSEYDDLVAGRWGFINGRRETVIEPQYVYAIGFDCCQENRCIVAKYIDGKLRWGVIDRDGEVIVPFDYYELYTEEQDVIFYAEEDGGDYGVMDFDGNVILKPTFPCIKAYDRKHGLVSVGEHIEALGVYSIREGKMLTPNKYGYIDFGENIISCEIGFSCGEEHYDYSGKQLFFEYDRVYERNGFLEVIKGGKKGKIDSDGNVLIPPILADMSDAAEELYHRGYVLTGSAKAYGLSTLDGIEILPPIYSEIKAVGDLLIVSQRTDTNWCICDSLYGIDGRPILKGTYRRMRINRNVLSADTPYGCVEYLIEYI